MTAEPRMEDLLASIRKAMDEEAGKERAGGNEPGALMRGTLREMRVAFDKTSRDPQPESLENLRQRVQRNNAQAGFSAPATPPLTSAQDVPSQHESPRTGFARILAGLKQPRVQQQADDESAPPPYLRRTIAPEDVVDEYELDDNSGAGEAGPYRDAADPYDDERPIHKYEPDVAHQEEARLYPPTRYAPPLPRSNRQTSSDQRAPRARGGSQADLPREKALVSEAAARASRSSFEDLAEALLARATSDRGLEDMTREMLRGMLRQWLDEHLPELVEQLVREEIERVARRGH